MVVYGSTKTFIWSCVIRRPSVLIDNLWARSDPAIALTLPHMATHADTINHGEYELETRGMPFETGRTSMASVCSFSLNLVSLSLSCTSDRWSCSDSRCWFAELRWPVTLGKLRTPLIKLLFPRARFFSFPSLCFILLERVNWTRVED